MLKCFIFLLLTGWIPKTSTIAAEWRTSTGCRNYRRGLLDGDGLYASRSLFPCCCCCFQHFHPHCSPPQHFHSCGKNCFQNLPRQRDASSAGAWWEGREIVPYFALRFTLAQISVIRTANMSARLGTDKGPPPLRQADECKRSENCTISVLERRTEKKLTQTLALRTEPALYKLIESKKMIRMRFPHW